MSRFDESRIPWHQGLSDDCYGTRLWVSRIQNLDTHFRIIADNLPEDCEWIANQVRSAREEARRYMENHCPAAGLALGASAIEVQRAETPQDGSVHESAVPKADAQDPSQGPSA